MRKSAYFLHMTVDLHWRSLSGQFNRELALVERSEKSFWVTRDEWPRVHAPIICIQSVSTLLRVVRKQTSLYLSLVTSLRTSAWEAMLRVDSNPSDLTSWSPTNAVKICARSVQQPPVQSGPYLTPLLS